LLFQCPLTFSPSVRMPSLDVPKQGLLPAHRRILYQINSILSQACLTPHLLGTLRGKWQVQWTGQGFQPDEEAGAFFALLGLATDGLLSQVKRCARPKCKKYFFALVPHQKFHSDSCTRRAYEQDADRKEYRRIWRRKHYREFEKKEK
jgi:hypothetical protein